MAYYFKVMDISDSAYILRQGKVHLELESGESFTLEGQNKVFGAGELLLNNDDGFVHYRNFSAVGDGGDKAIEIDDKKVEELIRIYNAGFAITKDLAEISVWLSDIANDKVGKIGQKERLHREYCKILYKAGNTIINEYNNKKFHWLEPLANKIMSTLEYKEGEAYSNNDKSIPLSIETKQLGKYNKEFPPGATICSQGEMGYELYVLNAGAISVEIGGNEVAQIDSPGTVIGELAPLLGQTRSATLKAVHNTILTVVKNTDLKKLCSEQKDFLRNIAITLTRRNETLSSKIRELTEMIDKNANKDDSIPDILSEDPTKAHLKELKKELKALYDKYDMEWIYDIYYELSESMMQVKK